MFYKNQITICGSCWARYCAVDMETPPEIDLDPFREAREGQGSRYGEFNGEGILMLLRHEAVRQAAKDWETFSSDAPFRVPIPSEEAVRSMRQLPIETDPPVHTAYRRIVEPFFQLPKEPGFIAGIEALVGEMLDSALTRESLEVVSEFALPLQSRALTRLLKVPETEADTWIGWGIHVFRVTGGAFKKGTVLEDYLHAQFDRAEAEPGEDFFSALAQAEFEGRPLTREEMMGFANLAFAGGRDTIIHSVSSILAYLAAHPEALASLLEDPKRVVHAGEEFFRVYMPLTHIGRVCPRETTVGEHTVAPGERVSLCWASANRDANVFEAADEIRLDRKPNPHLSFGFGTHLCLGAAHARLIVRTLLRLASEKVATLEILDSEKRIEREGGYERPLGFDSLTMRLRPR